MIICPELIKLFLKPTIPQETTQILAASSRKSPETTEILKMAEESSSMEESPRHLVYLRSSMFLHFTFAVHLRTVRLMHPAYITQEACAD
ncbi:hypothetical protein DV515_00000781 [Chloebia gouldiae]|uniref:Uncharacterized protein n=1 Tax=Chloebia gouldiae TaxID=44316 RepID=A0A3L8SZB9_CHLGU|nr:hypothetical protein DV515_00000781 [Chloebia gouldiae]